MTGAHWSTVAACGSGPECASSISGAPQGSRPTAGRELLAVGCALACPLDAPHPGKHLTALEPALQSAASKLCSLLHGFLSSSGWCLALWLGIVQPQTLWQQEGTLLGACSLIEGFPCCNPAAPSVLFLCRAELAADTFGSCMCSGDVCDCGGTCECGHRRW